MLCALVLASASPARALTPDTAPRCVETRAQMLTTVDSAKADPGDVFHFLILDAVPAVRAIPDIPAQTLGYGTVAFADHARANGVPGRLVLEPRFVRLADGTHVQVIADPQTADNFATGSTRNLNGALGFVPAVGIAVAGYNALHRGREIGIAKGTIFSLIVGDELAAGNCYIAPPGVPNVR